MTTTTGVKTGAVTGGKQEVTLDAKSALAMLRDKGGYEELVALGGKANSALRDRGARGLNESEQNALSLSRHGITDGAATEILQGIETIARSLAISGQTAARAEHGSFDVIKGLADGSLHGARVENRAQLEALTDAFKVAVADPSSVGLTYSQIAAATRAIDDEHLDLSSFSRGGISYMDSNIRSGLVDTVRDAFRAANLDPDDFQLPSAGPQML